MLRDFILIVFILFSLSGCSYKQPKTSQSATIIFKTPSLKFNDKGFIERYQDNVRLTVLNLGIVVTDMRIYKDKVCKNFALCFDGATFNDKFLDKSYEKDFMYNLFTQENINFKDKEHGILIKVIYDVQENIENNETR